MESNHHYKKSSGRRRWHERAHFRACYRGQRPQVALSMIVVAVMVLLVLSCNSVRAWSPGVTLFSTNSRSATTPFSSLESRHLCHRRRPDFVPTLSSSSSKLEAKSSSQEESSPGRSASTLESPSGDGVVGGDGFVAGARRAETNNLGKLVHHQAQTAPFWSGMAPACTTGLLALQILLACCSSSAVFPAPAAAAEALTTSTTTALSSSAASTTTTTTTPASPLTSLPTGKRYWTIQEEGTVSERVQANTALMDYAVGTINTMYYDHSAGAWFSPREFFGAWRHWLRQGGGEEQLQDRQGAVEGLRWLVGQLNDPFSKYLTREELRQELVHSSDGFLGLGAIVEPPGKAFFGSALAVPTNLPIPKHLGNTNINNKDSLLAGVQVQDLPVVTALGPDSPAERAGLTVGDRIVAVGTDSFLGRSSKQVAARLADKYHADNYLGHIDLTIAKPVYAASMDMDQGSSNNHDVVVAYRKTRVRLATIAATSETYRTVEAEAAGGDAIVHYELLTSQDSIFDRTNAGNNKVGYIRLTRFSRASTTGFIKAVQDLEAAGATSFIIDLRNNYGGVIQEAMLTASTLLRDPHAVLCYTMNSRGGFTPHDVEEYAVDTRYPGYLLSQEPPDVTVRQIKREDPLIFVDGGSNWVPPSSFASLHEQGMKRGIHRAMLSASLPWSMGLTTADSSASSSSSFMEVARRHQLEAQKNIVLLINEGTASSAEVFASALHDNGRIVALVGTKTFGKGLIQHTFPMPDGGGLRLTVAEYLTPALRHVTHVGGAQFDRVTGELVGGGIRPDILCESNSGIPGNIGADWCVGVALGTLEEAETAKQMNLPGQGTVKRVGGGLDDGTGVRRVVSAGIVKDDF